MIALEGIKKPYKALEIFQVPALWGRKEKPLVGAFRPLIGHEAGQGLGGNGAGADQVWYFPISYRGIGEWKE